MPTTLIDRLSLTDDATLANNRIVRRAAPSVAAGVRLTAVDQPVLFLPVGELSSERASIEFLFTPSYTAYNAPAAPRRYFFAITAGGGAPVVACAWFDSSLKLQITGTDNLNRVVSLPRPTAAVPQWTAATPVRVRFEWDAKHATDSMRIYLNGVRADTGARMPGGWTAQAFTGRSLFLGARSNTEGQLIDGAINELTLTNLDEPAIVVPPPLPVPTAQPFNAPITVRGAGSFPTTAIVPMPAGLLPADAPLPVLVGFDGLIMPAAISRLTAHTVDSSARHLRVDFFPTTAAPFSLREHRATDVVPLPTGAVTASFSDGRVSNGHYTLQCSRPITSVRGGIAVSTPAGQLSLRIDDRDEFARNDVLADIENFSDLRATLKLSAPTRLVGGQLQPGWVLRLTVFAGRFYTKAELQIQNALRTDKFSGPAAFKSVRLVLPAPAGSLTQITDAAPGSATNAVTASMVGATCRVFVRDANVAGPTRLETTTAEMHVDLWPDALTHRQQLANGQPSQAESYWLDDMQCVVKEAWIAFGGPETTATLSSLIQDPPVAMVDQDWFRAAGCTLDFDGALPKTSVVGSGKLVPDITTYGTQTSTLPLAQRQGWNFYACDVARKAQPSTTGGWPYSAARAFLTGDAADVRAALDFARGELNCMPQWLPGYTYAADYARLAPSSAPYAGWSWRAFEGGYGYEPLAFYPAPDGLQQAKPRDDQHAWFYHVEEAYYLTGDPWIRDWYQWVGEFRMTRLLHNDPYPDMSARAIGHTVSHALQAYRVVGDVKVLDAVGSYIRTFVAPLVDPALGGMKPRPDLTGGESPFQLGYLCRALISYLHERPNDSTAMALVEGFVRWNLTNGRYGYYTALTAVSPYSSGTAMTFCDVAAWYCLKRPGALADQVRVQLNEYITTGIGDVRREKPYIDLLHWSGDFLGRWVTLLAQSRGGSLT